MSDFGRKCMLIHSLLSRVNLGWHHGIHHLMKVWERSYGSSKIDLNLRCCRILWFMFKHTHWVPRQDVRVFSSFYIKTRAFCDSHVLLSLRARNASHSAFPVGFSGCKLNWVTYLLMNNTRLRAKTLMNLAKQWQWLLFLFEWTW